MPLGFSVCFGSTISPTDYTLLWRSGFGDSSVDERMAVRRAIYRNEQKIIRVKSTDVLAEQDLSGSFWFVGLEDQYFAAVFLPGLSEPMRRIQLGRDEHPTESGKKEEFLRAGVSGVRQIMMTSGFLSDPKTLQYFRRQAIT